MTRTVMLPPPVGGWNTRDVLGDMRPEKAARLDNWEPQEGACQIRPGYEEFATIPDASQIPIDMASYITANNNQLIVKTKSNSGGIGKFYAIEQNGTVAEIGEDFLGTASTLTFETVRFDDRIIWSSGFRAYSWNGTTFQDLDLQDNFVALGNVFDPLVYRGRMYYIATAIQSMFYGGSQAIQGNFTEFNFSLVSSLEGTIVGHTTVSRDAGNGPDDYYCALFSEGHVIVYTGNDPGLADSWQLVGVFKGPPPLLRPDGKVAAKVKLGGDTIVLTEDGYISLTRLMQFGDSDYERVRLSEEINDAVRANVQVAGRVGWTVRHHPRRDWLMIDVAGAGVSYQHVLKLDRNAWWRSNYPISGFCSHSGDLFFGHENGKIYRVAGRTDNGAIIYGTWWTGNTHCRAPDREKTFGWCVPLVSSNADFLDMDVQQGVDFANPAPYIAGFSEGLAGEDWGAAAWDVALWGKSPTMNTRRFALSGHGYRTSIGTTVGGPGLDARLHGIQIGFRQAQI